MVHWKMCSTCFLHSHFISGILAIQFDPQKYNHKHAKFGKKTSGKNVLTHIYGSKSLILQLPRILRPCASTQITFLTLIAWLTGSTHFAWGRRECISVCEQCLTDDTPPLGKRKQKVPQKTDKTGNIAEKSHSSSAFNFIWIDSHCPLRSALFLN